MEPISVALLVALATGTAGEVGRQAWAGLSALVRHPFRRGQGTADSATVSSGEEELTRLEQASTEPGRAQAAQSLSTALAARADLDPDFSADLQQWQARQMNLITGGHFYGPTWQVGGNVGGIPDPPAPPTTDTATPPQG